MAYLSTNEELQNMKLCIWQLTLYIYSIVPYVSSFPKMSLFHQLFLQNVMKSCTFAYYNMKGKVSTIAA
jgi:hypothetical protein